MPMRGYTLKGAYRVVKPGQYPWPCGDDPKRTFELLSDDILTRAENGTFTCHTGLMSMGIQIPEDAVRLDEGEVKLTGV